MTSQSQVPYTASRLEEDLPNLISNSSNLFSTLIWLFHRNLPHLSQALVGRGSSSKLDINLIHARRFHPDRESILRELIALWDVYCTVQASEKYPAKTIEWSVSLRPESFASSHQKESVPIDHRNVSAAVPVIITNQHDIEFTFDFPKGTSELARHRIHDLRTRPKDAIGTQEKALGRPALGLASIDPHSTSKGGTCFAHNNFKKCRPRQSSQFWSVSTFNLKDRSLWYLRKGALESDRWSGRLVLTNDRGRYRNPDTFRKEADTASDQEEQSDTSVI
ncbi:hypothetical protein K438DRAFT_1773322 [Mycena galopus ATCC 62051]|nr:hypothetical protein K438DRAFT_1773322 [Mycena galopus ATCC 62051]